MNKNDTITITIPLAAFLEPLKVPLMKEMLEALTKMNSEKMEKKEEEFITRQMAAKILLVSLPTLKKIYSSPNAAVKAYRVGNGIRFKRSEILACAQQVRTVLHSRNQKTNH
jgi:hypothetical protein